MAIGINLLILLLLAAGVICLQVFLAKRESKWLGLIMPALSFFLSLLLIVSIIAYANIGITARTVTESGHVISQTIEDTRPAFGDVAAQAVITFLLANIPTVILAAIYAACREKKKRRREIDKMQVQDLE